ncbi:hypothetical protein [Rheinheimera sp. WS51]|uniref:hypothetical protein n=1 Tax=Rheinheimera sp. WS51 TaxID=3425886 RepID=UPI003D92C54C
MKLTTKIATLSLLLSSTVMLNVNAENLGNLDKVSGSADIQSHQQYADISLVNGSINMATQSQAKEISTVNGSIRLADQVRLHSASTVNGKIVAGSGLLVATDLAVVNGKIDLGKQAQVKGNISTVNGGINVIDSTVGGDITTLNGDISLKGHSVIHGNIIYSKTKTSWSNWSWWPWSKQNSEKDIPTLSIDETVVINGNIILNQAVNLNITSPVLRAKVIDKT